MLSDVGSTMSEASEGSADEEGGDWDILPR
jgi:hypothetical protein